MRIKFINLKIIVSILLLYIAFEGAALLLSIFIFDNIYQPYQVVLPLARSAVAGAIAFYLWRGHKLALYLFVFGCIVNITIFLLIINFVIGPGDSVIVVLLILIFLFVSSVGLLVGIFNSSLRGEMEERRKIHKAKQADRLSHFEE